MVRGVPAISACAGADPLLSPTLVPLNVPPLFFPSFAYYRSPGLTSPTAALPTENLPIGTPVAVHAAGKEMALGIGLTTMSTDDIKRLNKNVGVENVAFLGDDLWVLNKI